MKIIRTHLDRPTSVDKMELEWVYAVPLTRGYEAWVDEQDYERIAALNWYAVGDSSYVRAGRRVRGWQVYMQHEVLGIMPWDIPKGTVILHADKNRLNNWRSNLVIGTKQDAMLRTARHINRVGYCFNKRAGLYCVYLDRPKQKRIYLGYTTTEEAAQYRVEHARGICGL